MVGILIIALGAWVLARGIAMLNRYLANGVLRHEVIAGDLDIDPAKLPMKRILLNGVPADVESLPGDTPVIEGWKDHEQISREFADWKPIFASKGRSPEGRTYILSASGFHGFSRSHPQSLRPSVTGKTESCCSIPIAVMLAESSSRSPPEWKEQSGWKSPNSASSSAKTRSLLVSRSGRDRLPFRPILKRLANIEDRSRCGVPAWLPGFR